MTKAIKRSEIIHVRLTEEERARFSAACAPDDAPISEAVRRLMREAAGLGPTFDGDGRGQNRRADGAAQSDRSRHHASGAGDQRRQGAGGGGDADDVRGVRGSVVGGGELLSVALRDGAGASAVGGERVMSGAAESIG